MRFQAAPKGDRSVNGQRLLDLADIDKILKCDGKAKIPKNCLGDAGIAADILLMAFHDWRSDVEVVRIRKPPDNRH